MRTYTVIIATLLSFLGACDVLNQNNLFQVLKHMRVTISNLIFFLIVVVQVAREDQIIYGGFNKYYTQIVSNNTDI